MPTIDRARRGTAGPAPFAFGAILILAGAAQALDRTPVEQRRALAAQLCGHCHALHVTGSGMHPGAPSFRHLAARVELDGLHERLREGLIAGHRDMPQMKLTRDEARAIVAFIRSIQTP